MSIAESFGQSGFARFINSTAGRVLRAAVGIAVICWGYTQRGSTTGLILIVVGLVPLAAGTFNLCLVSALLGGPLFGSRISKPNP
jgi:hypothetical protein